MIIHNPIISGSIQFPADADGNKVTLQVNSGVLETIQIDSSNNPTAVKPESNLSGSFTGSFLGDGSGLTGVSAINIDALNALGGATVAQGDNLVISDAGTEKKVTFSNLEDSIFGNISGNATIAAGGVLTIASSFLNTSLNAATGSYLTTVDISTDTNLAVSDTTEVNMILTDDTLSAELIGGVVSGSAQVDYDSIQNQPTTITGGQASAITANTAKTGITTGQASAITTNTAKTGITSGQASAITANTAKVTTNTSNVTSAGALMDSEVTNLADVKAFDTSDYLAASITTISGGQASAITANTAKTGITSGQASAITTNTAKTGITSGQASAITTNTNKVGYTDSLVKTKLDADTVSSGSAANIKSFLAIGSSDISDVAAFSQSGTYASLRAQSTTKGDVGLGSVDNTSDAGKPVSTAQQTEIDTKSDIASPTFTGTVGGITKGMVGLGNVDNTTDALKPVSTAGQTALNLKANLASPTLTGNPTAPTQADNDDSTKIATTAYVQREVSDLLGGAPAAFDTLLEISASIANGDSDVVALTTTVGTKLAKSTNLSDLANAGTARTNLGVDVAGTDNSTNVTLVTDSHDYLSVSGQAITLGSITNDDLAGSITNAKLSNSSITIDSSAISLGGSVTTLQLGTSGTTALAGNTTTISGAQASAITANTAKTGITSGQASAITANTAKISYNSTASTKLGTIEGSADVTDTANVTAAGALMDSEVTNLVDVKAFDTSDYLASSVTTISGAQASAISANTAKTGITSGQASAITANTAKVSDINHNVTTNLSISGTTGARTIASSDGTDAIIPLATTSVSGLLSPGLFDEIDVNTAKTGITSGQASAITTNTAKTGITSGQASAISANTAKTGITSGQASAITANTAKNTNVSTNLSISGTTGARTIASSDGTNAIIPIATTSVSGLLSPGLFDEIDANTAKTGISSGQASAITANTAKISYNSAASTKLATIAEGAEVNVVDSVAGKTGTVSLVKGDVGLGNVDNTTDALKPVSTAGQTALNLKANLASPTFTGVPISTTPTSNDSSTKIATTAYVQGELTDLIGGAPAAFDTLLEISASIANGDSDVVALTTTVGTKLAKSTNLSDLANAGTARTNLGLGSAAVSNTGDFLASSVTTISGGQASAITANTAKTGITSGQASAITANTAKTGITSGQASAITANTAKTGITSGQASAITANTAKISYNSTASTKLGTIEESADVTDTTNVTAAGALMDSEVTNLSQVKSFDSSDYLASSVTTISSGQASAITTNTAKTSDINHNVSTNLSITGTSGARTITSSDGTNAVIPIATTSVSGLLSPGLFDEIDTNTAKTGITSTQAGHITANNAKVSNVTTNLSITGTSGARTITSSDGTNAIIPIATTSVSGLLSPSLFDEIDANTAKTGITSGQASAITANTAKTGITSGQASAITANTAKTGITSGQASAITANTAKTGITSGQASAITANTAKTSDINHNVSTNLSKTTATTQITINSSDGDNVVIGEATGTIAGLMSTTHHNKLDGIAASANNYSHPTNYAGDNIDIDTTPLTGAVVISDLDINITTDTNGHVSDANASVATRTLTKADLGLGNATNESKATMFTSPTFTGTPVAPTPAANTNTTQLATTAYVQTELTDLIGGAPGTLDTLNELAAAINDDASYASTLTTALGLKAPKASPTFTGTIAIPSVANLSTAVVANTAKTSNIVQTTVSGNAGSVTNGVYTTGTQTIGGAKSFSSAVNIDSTVASTTKTTGALIVDGGVGIAGALNVGGDIVAYASSDERLKDNIELISNPIEKVQSLKGVTWDWNSNADILQQTLPNVGVIAQDVEKVLPQLVIDRDNGFKGVDYAKLTGLLIEAVKDQQKQIDELKSKLS